MKAARSLLAKARAGDLNELFTVRDVYRKAWAGLDKEQATEAADMLAAHGWLTEVTIETGGRPATVYGLAEGARRG